MPRTNTTPLRVPVPLACRPPSILTVRRSHRHPSSSSVNPVAHHDTTTVCAGPPARHMIIGAGAPIWLATCSRPPRLHAFISGPMIIAASDVERCGVAFNQTTTTALSARLAAAAASLVTSTTGAIFPVLSHDYPPWGSDLPVSHKASFMQGTNHHRSLWARKVHIVRYSACGRRLAGAESWIQDYCKWCISGP
ncbi:hypothetical protein P154DRAFT_271258 [Amniculicola lignicola CBS 123094]|uniref:Uncharacterized protein n=1 Tax=Amniculicola lignicola CBS 123094 TaxID=1392246 RepID=A0A6A5W7P9_9PLEO|nr:hypothetical protein P154DRAFT_271258 [Amniculicola lignicola CBS 123094]